SSHLQLQLFQFFMKIELLFEFECRIIYFLLIKMIADELQTDRTSIPGKAARNGECGHACQIRGYWQNVILVHLQAVITLLTDVICRRRCRRSNDKIVFRE